MQHGGTDIFQNSGHQRFFQSDSLLGVRCVSHALIHAHRGDGSPHCASFRPCTLCSPGLHNRPARIHDCFQRIGGQAFLAGYALHCRRSHAHVGVTGLRGTFSMTGFHRIEFESPCLKAGDSSIRSWGAFGSLLRFVSLASAINGGDKRETRVQTGSGQWSRLGVMGEKVRFFEASL